MNDEYHHPKIIIILQRINQSIESLTRNFALIDLGYERESVSLNFVSNKHGRLDDFCGDNRTQAMFEYNSRTHQCTNDFIVTFVSISIISVL